MRGHRVPDAARGVYKRSSSRTTGSRARSSTAIPPTGPGSFSSCGRVRRLGQARYAHLRSALTGGGANPRRCSLARRRRDLRLQRRMQGQDPRRGFRQGRYGRRCPGPHQGLRLLRLVHGPRRALLNHALGEAFAAGPAVKPMCSCTSYGHDDVRRLIVAKELRSIPEVMQELGWSSPDGCSKCRPALNYYLVCAWPGEYRDDPQSRLINERAHANIQKDGTYSVVPRMGAASPPPRNCGPSRTWSNATPFRA